MKKRTARVLFWIATFCPIVALSGHVLAGQKVGLLISSIPYISHAALGLAILGLPLLFVSIIMETKDG